MPQEMLLHALQSAPSSSPTTTTLSLEMPQQLFRPLQQPQTLFRFLEHLSQITLQLLICQTGQALQERIFQVLQDLAPLDEQAKCIKELFPDAKNIGIIYCSSEPNSIYQSTTITKYLEDEGYTVKEYTFSDSNDVAAVTQSACDASDAIYIPTDNTAASCTEAINNVASQAKKPIFAGEEGIAKGCGVATLSISYYDLGYTTGEMAYDILVNGTDVKTMEVKSASKFTKEYLPDRAKELGITVPDGYEEISAE